MGDAVLAADLVEQHFTGAGTVLAEPVGELLAVVRDDLLRHPELGQGLRQRKMHCPVGGSFHHLGDHAEPGMVVDRGEQLRFFAFAPAAFFLAFRSALSATSTASAMARSASAV